MTLQDPTVFVSSTGLDLSEYRDATFKICRKLKFHVVAMEDFEAMGKGATDGSLTKLNDAQVYVGIFGHRYGFVEDGYSKSVTELEFDEAGKHGLERLCFLVDPTFPWPPDTWDYENYGKLKKFKDRIETRLIRAHFTSVNDFKLKLHESLLGWRQRRGDGEPDSVEFVELCYDEQPVSSDWSVIDEERLRKYLVRVAEDSGKEELVSSSVTAALEELGLLRDNRLTIAAVLLFSESPQKLLRHASVKCSRYKGLSTLDSYVADGALERQLRSCESFIKRNIRKGWSIQEFERQEKYEYPLNALREALANALIHRDYRVHSECQIRIFDNRLEIWSPGGLAAPLSMEELQEDHLSYRRNVLIAEAFTRLHYMETQGTGIQRIVRECEEHGLRRPQFRADEGAVTVIIHGPGEYFLTEPQSAALTTPPSLPRLEPRISVAKLPTTSHLLLGRESQLAQLTAAWEADHTHVVSIVAPGGVGKTALVNRWLGDMAQDDYCGAQRVYGWSFYSQGAGGSKGASADTFIEAALAWFGDPDPAAGSPWQRGERLAELVGQERTLLLLDGLESLQEPPRTGLPSGRLKDPAIQAVLRYLAASNAGLCVITTREEVEDLDSKVGTTVERLDLNELSPEAGAALLRAYKLEAPEVELREISVAFAGHALSLTLLATYLRDVCDGDVRRWREVPLLEEDAQQGSHAFRVMKSYENWLGKGAELAVLYLLGLFDRPASEAEIAALLEEPAIPGLTDGLMELGESSWKRALARLRDARLIADPGGPGEVGGLDAHPLVRTYFGDRLEETRPDAYQAGHQRLYEHLRQAAPYQPDTLEEMRPLYHAVHHGCRAGQIQEALEEVYLSRILRGAEQFSWRKLGAFGSDLAAVSGFFERPWDRPAAQLSEPAQGFVLNAAGFALRAQGRLAEAVVPMRAGVEHGVSQSDWKEAAIRAGNLSELLLTLGRVEEAVEAARESVELADRSGDEFERLKHRAKLADALHQAGRLEEARELFEEAEALQAEAQPEYPLLYSLAGYRYCDLLLAMATRVSLLPPFDQKGEAPSRPSLTEREGGDASPLAVSPEKEEELEGGDLERIRQRAEQTIKIAQRNNWLLDIALDHLTLGRTHFALAWTDRVLEPDPTHLAQATAHLDRAMDGLRQSGDQWMQPLALVARAALHRFIDAPDAATRDLDEAFEIAERGGMRLHLTDARLERARLRVSQGQSDEARQDLEAARTLVEETGYHRRDPEVAALAGDLSDAGPVGESEK